MEHAPNGLRYLLAVGVDSIRTQKNIHARKLFENAADSRQSGARFVGRGINELALLPRGTEFFMPKLILPFQAKTT